MDHEEVLKDVLSHQFVAWRNQESRERKMPK